MKINTRDLFEIYYKDIRTRGEFGSFQNWANKHGVLLKMNWNMSTVEDIDEEDLLVFKLKYGL
jgi:hypothetical protein